jgi:hypothetical protein
MENLAQKIEAARSYLAATVALTPDSPPADLLAAAAEYRVHLAALLEVIDDQWITYPEPAGEQARLRAELLAEVPAWLHEYALTGAVATDLSRHPGGTIATVTSWLRAVRRETPADTAEALTALAARIDEQLADETGSRQAIAEEASARIKDIAWQLPRREVPPTVQEMREIFFPEDPEGRHLPGAGEGDAR